MGFKLKKTEVLKLEPNEEKDICLTLVPEDRAAIHGVVKFPGGAPVKNALVKLFVKKGSDCCELIPVTFAFTDDCGQFLFGVHSKVEYVIKVFFYRPEKHKPCDKDDKDDCDDC